MNHLNGNILAAVDVETTGVIFGYNEIIQIAIVPLDFDLKPDDSKPVFYLPGMAPAYPERQTKQAKMKHHLDAKKLAEEGIPQDRAAALLDEWFVRLNLPIHRRIIPLAHNWAFERGHLTHWLGIEQFDDIFYIHPRDTMTFASSINDAAAWAGHQKVFNTLSLTAMCKNLGIPLENAHNALADCIATAALYRELLSMFS